MSDFIYDQVRDLRNKMEASEQLIAATQLQLSEDRTAFNTLVAKLLRIGQPEVRKANARFFYWEFEKSVAVAVIADAMGITVHAVPAFVGALSSTANCSQCHQTCDMTVTSRADRDAKRSSYSRVICEDCKAKREELRRLELEQYHADKAAKAELVQSLKRMPYAAYLKTDHWQTLRAKMLKRAGGRCQVCNKSGVSLHVHHRTYERRGEEDYNDLIVLCASCHHTFHEQGKLAS